MKFCLLMYLQGSIHRQGHISRPVICHLVLLPYLAILPHHNASSPYLASYQRGHIPCLGTPLCHLVLPPRPIILSHHNASSPYLAILPHHQDSFLRLAILSCLLGRILYLVHHLPSNRRNNSFHHLRMDIGSSHRQNQSSRPAIHRYHPQQ